MDNTLKYLHLKHDGKNAIEIAREIAASAITPLYAIKKNKENISASFFNGIQGNCNYCHY